MSGFVSEQLSPGDRLHVAGPLGTCFYEGVILASQWRWSAPARASRR